MFWELISLAMNASDSSLCLLSLEQMRAAVKTVASHFLTAIISGRSREKVCADSLCTTSPLYITRSLGCLVGCLVGWRILEAVTLSIERKQEEHLTPFQLFFRSGNWYCLRTCCAAHVMPFFFHANRTIPPPFHFLKSEDSAHSLLPLPTHTTPWPPHQPLPSHTRSRGGQVYNFVQLEEVYYAGSHGMDIMGPPTTSSGTHSLDDAPSGTASSGRDDRVKLPCLSTTTTTTTT